MKKLAEEWWKERDGEVRAKNPNSSRFFFLLGPVSRCETRRGEERGGGQEKRQDTRFPSRRVILGASRFVQEPVDVPTRRQTRIDPPIAAPRAPCTNATAKPSSQSFSSAEREKGNRGRTTRKWKSAIDSWRQATGLGSGYRFLRVSSLVARDFDFDFDKDFHRFFVLVRRLGFTKNTRRSQLRLAIGRKYLQKCLSPRFTRKMFKIFITGLLLSILPTNLLNNQNYSCRLKRGSYMEFLSPIHYLIKLEHRTNGNGDSHFH